MVNLSDVDPDDTFSSIPYQKDQMLLYHLEELLGGPGNVKYSILNIFYPNN